MGQNLMAQHLTAEQWNELDEAIARVHAILEPVLVKLSPAGKKTMVKMGEGSEAFCRQALGVMRENEALMPRSLDLDEMRRDLEAHDALNARMVTLTRLLERVRDAEMALGSDVMVSALEGYAVLKAVGRNEGVQALKQLLGRRFESAPRQDKPAPATT